MLLGGKIDRALKLGADLSKLQSVYANLKPFLIFRMMLSSLAWVGVWNFQIGVIMQESKPSLGLRLTQLYDLMLSYPESHMIVWQISDVDAFVYYRPEIIDELRRFVELDGGAEYGNLQYVKALVALKELPPFRTRIVIVSPSETTEAFRKKAILLLNHFIQVNRHTWVTHPHRYTRGLCCRVWILRQCVERFHKLFGTHYFSATSGYSYCFGDLVSLVMKIFSFSLCCFWWGHYYNSRADRRQFFSEQPELWRIAHFNLFSSFVLLLLLFSFCSFVCFFFLFFFFFLF